MPFDQSMIDELRAVAEMLHEDDAKYLMRQEELSRSFAGRESLLEDIIYDFDEGRVRIEAMMICKLMPTMERLRIFEDISLAGEDPDVKHWGGVLFRQEHLLVTARRWDEQRK